MKTRDHHARYPVVASLFPRDRARLEVRGDVAKIAPRNRRERRALRKLKRDLAQKAN